jgi:hypothetical protein
MKDNGVLLVRVGPGGRFFIVRGRVARGERLEARRGKDSLLLEVP